MRRFSTVAGTLAAASTLLAGCSAGTSALGVGSRLPTSASAGRAGAIAPSGTSGPRSAMLPRSLWPAPRAFTLHARTDVQKGYIFNSQANYSVVNYYQKGRGNVPVAGSFVAAFNFPQGVSSDTAGNVYVANTGSADVFVFAPGATSPTTTLNDPGQQPIDVAVAKNGTTYVANIATSGGGPGSVSVYPPGTTNPSLTLRDDNFQEVVGIALDKRGDVFVSYSNGQSSGSVAEFPARSQTAQETGIAIGFPGGVAFDKTGNLLVVDQFTGILNVFTVGNSMPTAELTLPGDGCFIAFGTHDKTLYLADFQNESIDVLDYAPTALTLVDQITSGMNPYGNALGIATTRQTTP
jgi:hypothetical protein